MNRAFTLIEVLVVIAIIGILASILIPTVQRLRDSSHYMNAQEYQLYEAWRKANHYPVTTFDEWQMLRANGMLNTVR